MRRLLAILGLATIGANVSQAYYHFLRYVNRDGHTIPLAQKFDIAALPNKTITFFLTTDQPAKMAEGDSLPSLISQLQLAARQWNDVETSELRVQFGGILSSPVESQTGPGIDIVFSEIPPGLIALGGPTVVAEPEANQKFVPIRRSQILLPQDMSNMPSWSERTFATLVHEFGHTLGLQHSLASAAMSTDITRAVTKGRVLAADDVAGISLLYPAPAFAANLGSISGRVTSNGVGLSLASVVAISARGAAVGTLTGPDGTYRIDGIPAGDYYVYTHSLPPPQLGEVTPANIILPLNEDLKPIPASSPFDLLFYPGATEPAQATSIPVKAAASIEGIDLSVAGRNAPQSLYNVLTYSFPGQVAVRPAHVNKNGSRNYFVATGSGLLASATQPVSGLRTSILGGSAQITGIRSYSDGYLRFDLGYDDSTGEGTRHLVFSTPGEVHVQPSALTLTKQQPPSIASIAREDTNTLTITGSNFSSATRAIVDGSPVVIRSVAEDGGRITVNLPPSLPDQRSMVVAFNPDGQSSLFLQTDNAGAQVLPGAPAPGVTVSPSSLPAGVEGALEIESSGAAFASGQVTVGFGTSDIVVKRVAAVSATKLIVQVRVLGSAPLATHRLTITNGLQVFTQEAAFSVSDGGEKRTQVIPTSRSPISGIAAALPGEAILLTIAGFSEFGYSATLGGAPVALRSMAPSVAVVTIPGDATPGLTILRLKDGDHDSIPIAVEVYRPSLEIASMDVTEASAGASLTLKVPGLRDLITPFAKLNVSLQVGGVPHLARVSPSDNTVSFTLLPAVPAGDATVSLRIDGRQLPVVNLAVVQ